MRQRKRGRDERDERDERRVEQFEGLFARRYVVMACMAGLVILYRIK